MVKGGKKSPLESFREDPYSTFIGGATFEIIKNIKYRLDVEVSYLTRDELGVGKIKEHQITKYFVPQSFIK